MKYIRKRKFLIVATSVVAVMLLLVGVCVAYLGDYYRADEGAAAAFAPEELISISTLKDGSIVFEPQNATVGLIFYPGGKVDHNAYQPLLSQLAREGVLCILVEMPFRLAVFDVNAADGIQEQYPEIESWYIGGHSLGGSMAAYYLADHTEEYDGLILLASYSTSDLSNTELDVLSVFGSEDKVLNRPKYDKNKSNLPDNFVERIIDGGNHAQFGMYGAQNGDGEPLISREEQTRLTVEEILKVMR